MNSSTEPLLPGTAIAPEGSSAAGVEFLSGDVMTRFWNEGESAIAMAAKKKPKKKSRKVCATHSCGNKKKKKER